MKRNYSKPETVMVEVVTSVLANSVGFNDKPTGPKDAGEGRGGQWGDVWK